MGGILKLDDSCISNPKSEIFGRSSVRSNSKFRNFGFEMGFRPISKFVCFVCLLFISTLSAQSSLPIIVDTDAGADDIIALAYLLSSRDARIEAITVVHGVAHVSEGSRNIRRLLTGNPCL